MAFIGQDENCAASVRSLYCTRNVTTAAINPFVEKMPHFGILTFLSFADRFDSVQALNALIFLTDALGNAEDFLWSGDPFPDLCQTVVHHADMVRRRRLDDLFGGRARCNQFSQRAGDPEQFVYADPTAHTGLAALIAAGAVIKSGIRPDVN